MMESRQEIDVRQEVLAADERIRPHVLETPVEQSIYMSQLIEGTVYLKMDLQQTTGSFKFRGATSKIMSLSEEELDRGVISASTGNYALAIAEAMKNIGREATIYMANDVPQARLDLIRTHGLNIVMYGDEAWKAEKKARAVADSEGKTYVSPYNDRRVVGGQGTCGLEIARQVPSIDTLIAACGGGGLVAGTAGYLKSCNPSIQTIAVSPEKSPVMYESLQQGKMVEMETFATLADTCAGGVDLDTITFGLCQKYVDEIVLVTEAEIEDAIRLLFEQHRLVAEGSAALSVAYLLRNPERFRGQTVVPVVCGKNIGTELFKSIINRQVQRTT
jgi:threonine dehydratase